MWYGIERPNKRLMDDNDTWIDTNENTYVVNKDECTVFLDKDEPLSAILNDLWLGGD